jgi:hypothetical protein
MNLIFSRILAAKVDWSVFMSTSRKSSRSAAVRAPVECVVLIDIMLGLLVRRPESADGPTSKAASNLRIRGGSSGGIALLGCVVRCSSNMLSVLSC